MFAKFAKAIYGGLVAGLGALSTVLVGNTTLDEVTQGQWVIIAVATLTVGGGVGVIRNYQPDVLVRLHAGQLVAGDGALQPTGQSLSPQATLDDVTPTQE